MNKILEYFTKIFKSLINLVFSNNNPKLKILECYSHQWLLGLPEDSFDSWEELRQAFIDNFIATCE